MSVTLLYRFLDSIQIQKILAAKRYPAEIKLSLDVGLSEQTVILHPERMQLPNGEVLPLPSISLLQSMDERTILIFREGEWYKWQFFDEKQNRFYKMVFVAPGRPLTVEINGIKMHVTQNGDPALDTERKCRALGRVRGIVLDTCCGLGYTAISLSRNPAVQKVITIEKDRNIVRFCRQNPWSRELFLSPKIQLIIGDVSTVAGGFPVEYFSGILHDPPRYVMAPELYHPSFYRSLYRILRKGGKIYHYTGDPGKRKGFNLPLRVANWLKQAGFISVRRCYQGICARKG